MDSIEKVFDSKYNDGVLNRKLYILYQVYKYDPICLSVLTNIERYKTELLGYRGIPVAPVSTNLIEGEWLFGVKTLCLKVISVS